MSLRDKLKNLLASINISNAMEDTAPVSGIVITEEIHKLLKTEDGKAGMPGVLTFMFGLPVYVIKNVHSARHILSCAVSTGRQLMLVHDEVICD
jgi:hypothetical protein